jgi:hypothetical protein
VVTCLLIVRRPARRFALQSPCPRDLRAWRLPRPCRGVSALNSPFSFVFFDLQHSNLRTFKRFRANSFTLISFADPHPLNSVVSYRYKNMGGEGAPPNFPASHTQNPVAHLRFFSTTCAMPLAQLLSFDNHANWWGEGELACARRGAASTNALFLRPELDVNLHRRERPSCAPRRLSASISCWSVFKLMGWSEMA